MDMLPLIVVLLQIGVVTLIAWATGSGKMFTQPMWAARIWLMYHVLCVRSIFEDLYYRNKQKVIDCSDKTGCVAVVTGGGRGLGYFIVRGLVERGMVVVVGVRNPDNCKNLAEDFRKEGLKGSVELMTLDTSSMRSVKEFAAAVQSKHPEIHVLVNNAGQIFGDYEETEDGFEMKLASNYLGHFMLTHSLVGSLERGGRAKGEYSRVVNVASCVHGCTGGLLLADMNMKDCYVRLGAYSHSKLAQIMFSRHLNRLLASKILPIRSSALHPGVVASNMAQDWKDSVLRKALYFFKTEAEGAMSALYCALDRGTESGADFISNMRESGTSCSSKNVDKQRELFELTCKMLEIKSFGQKTDV